jgi:SAM-dependent methyltransferase
MRRFHERPAAERDLLVDAVADDRVGRVLDLGCGAGHDLIPFLERTAALCVGVDIGGELGAVTAEAFGGESRAAFVRGRGEELPFADGSFDVVLCRVALPYMDHRRAIAETARVLAPGGALLLKTHAAAFYFSMLRERIGSMNPKMLAYPLICLAGGVWHWLTGRQPAGEFWDGKEIFQTRRFLEREFARHGLSIKEGLTDDNRLTPSYLVRKSAG